jgi:methionyl-tRNA formyltransferase
MHVVLLCATRRGYLFLEKLIGLVPSGRITVCSFREEPWEPPFLEDIRRLALASGGRFFETRQIGGGDLTPFWEATAVDLMFAVSWRYKIPADIYRRPRLGTFVLHDSLLPAYRGFSPTVWAMLNGEDHSGATLFEISDGIDEGDIVDQERVPIGPDDGIAAVMERVTQAYLILIERNLEMLIHARAPRFPQDHARATYGCKRLPEDNQIDWFAPSEKIYNLIRAVSAPYPGAYTTFAGKRLRIWSARRPAKPYPYVGRIPGRIVEVFPGEGSVVLTGDGALLLSEVQMEGGETVNSAELLNRLSYTLGC